MRRKRNLPLQFLVNFILFIGLINCREQTQDSGTRIFSSLVKRRVEIPRIPSSSSSSSSPSSKPSLPVWSSSLLALTDAQFQSLFLPGGLNLSSKLTNNSAISEQCRRSLTASFADFKRRSSNSVTMFNSWGRLPPAGLRLGTMTDLGDYDQCLSLPQTVYCLLETPMPMPERPGWINLYDDFAGELLGRREYSRGESPKEDHGFETRKSDFVRPEGNSFYWALANVSSFFYYMNMQTGVCLPALCDSNDAVQVGRELSSNFNLQTTKAHCEARAGWHLSRVQVIALLVFAAVIVLNIVSYAVRQPEVEHSSGGVLRGRFELSKLEWFNPRANMNKLLWTRDGQSELGCLHGIRALTILWIVAGHALDWNALNMFRATFAIRERFGALHTQPFFKAYYAVDTFFLLSGLLTSYVTLKYTKGSFQSFSGIGYILVRYLRLTPQLGLYLLFSTLLPLLASGPVWAKNMDFMLERCERTWWRNLVYVQNMFDMPNMCALHSWYLAADMQLHWMSVLPVGLLLWRRRTGLKTMAGMLAGSVLVLAAVVYVDKLPPGVLITARYMLLDSLGGPAPYLQFFYKPWTHAPAFLIGLLFGYWIWQTKLSNVTIREKESRNRKLESIGKALQDESNGKHPQQNNDCPSTSPGPETRIRQKFSLADKVLSSSILNGSLRASIWLLCVGLYLICLYDTWPWHFGRPPTPAASALLYPLNVVLWSLMLVIVMWMCITGNGGMVDKILSAPVWRPLSRITYSVYLTHPWVIALLIGARRQPFVQDFGTVVSHLLTVFVLSFVVGLLFSVLFEAPFCNAMNALKPYLMPKTNSIRVQADKGADKESTDKANFDHETVASLLGEKDKEGENSTTIEMQEATNCKNLF